MVDLVEQILSLGWKLRKLFLFGTPTWTLKCHNLVPVAKPKHFFMMKEISTAVFYSFVFIFIIIILAPGSWVPASATPEVYLFERLHEKYTMEKGPYPIKNNNNKNNPGTLIHWVLLTDILSDFILCFDQLFSLALNLVCGGTIPPSFLTVMTLPKNQSKVFPMVTWCCLSTCSLFILIVKNYCMK